MTTKTEWFKHWFSTQDYLDLYKHRNKADARKIIRLILKNVTLPKGSDILDLPCGNGRHSFLFAAKGFNVTGIDLSEYFIKQAKKKLTLEYPEYKKRVQFIQGDMRKIYYRNKFNLAVNLFTSFGYFDSIKENEQVIKAVSQSLVKGGCFFLDFINREYLLNNLVPMDLKEHSGKLFISMRKISRNFVQKNIIVIDKATRKQKEFKERIRLFSKDELTKMFKKHNLKVTKVFGNYWGTKFNLKTSDRLILLAKKI